MAVVLMQVFLEKIQVSLLESLAPFLYEFDLWRDGHCEARLEVGGYLPEDSKRRSGSSIIYPPSVRSTDSRGAQSTIQ